MITKLEKKVEVKGKLCEALAYAYEAELAFKEESDQVDALSHSSIVDAITTKA